MTDGMTCYERDEDLCVDPMCLRTGCRLRNERLGGHPARSAAPGGYASEQGEPIAWCAYHKTHGWRPDLAAKDQQTAVAAAMRAIESAGQQGWEIQPLYPNFAGEVSLMRAALQKAIGFAKRVAAMDDMRDAPGCAEIARKYQAIFEAALSPTGQSGGDAKPDEVVFLRKIDAGTDNECWVIGNRVDHDAIPFGRLVGDRELNEGTGEPV